MRVRSCAPKTITRKRVPPLSVHSCGVVFRFQKTGLNKQKPPPNKRQGDNYDSELVYNPPTEKTRFAQARSRVVPVFSGGLDGKSVGSIRRQTTRLRELDFCQFVRRAKELSVPLCVVSFRFVRLLLVHFYRDCFQVVSLDSFTQ